MTTLLLGLVAAVMLGIAGWMLYQAFRKRTLRPIPDAQGRMTPPEPVRVGPPPARAAILLSAAAMLALLAFFGRHVVHAFYARTEVAARITPATTQRLSSSSGAQLAVAHYGTKDGPVVVLTHGWGADRRDWAYLLAALPKSYHVVLWDLPGLGESSPTSGMEYSMATLAKDLDTVVSNVSSKPVVLVGHSVGGILNLEYARRYPEKVGREVVAIVQVNTTFTNPIETKKNPELSRMLQKPLFEPLLHLVSATAPVARGLGWLAYQSGMAHIQLASQSFAGMESWGQLDEMARYAYRSSPKVVAKGVMGMLRWDGSNVLPQIAVPTLVIAGAQDTTTLPMASERMARDIPQAEMVTVQGAAHLGPVERADQYAQLISRFVDQVSLNAVPRSVASGGVIGHE
ncbi:MAG TPA: alpha/beta hydrolase [Burkholderiaceae bacterium]|nr:alpha/beta hydrolase [Burkholderiaceae bacterium]